MSHLLKMSQLATVLILGTLGYFFPPPIHAGEDYGVNNKMNSSLPPKRVYQMKRVINDQTIELVNGTIVRLLGVDTAWDGNVALQTQTKDLLEKLSLAPDAKLQVVLVYDEVASVASRWDDENRLLAYVCGGGQDVAEALLESPEYDRKSHTPAGQGLAALGPVSKVPGWGFLELEIDGAFLPWNKKMLKWYAVFWNATLIRTGYARVARDVRHRFYDDFLAYEAEARASKRGLWPEFEKQKNPRRF